jgi:hypothetical protein
MFEMRRESMRVILLSTIVMTINATAWTPGAAAQNTPAAANAPAAGPNAATPAVAEQADRLLRRMSAYIGSAQQFTFHADITFDHVLPSGQKLQFSAAEDVVLQRPNQLYVEWTGDLGDRQFWYDGTSITLYDPATPFYATAPAPAEIDGMLDKLVSQVDFAPPLADFLYRDPYANVRGKVQYGIDLGLNDVNGRSCRTLAFVEKDIDWQIWIEDGPQLIPCKIVITYKTRPAQPQFSAIFTNWDFAPRIAASVFTPVLPSGTSKVEFQAVASTK